MTAEQLEKAKEERRIREEMEDYYAEDGNFFVGMLWATVLSIPIWVSLYGWVNIVKDFMM